MIKGADLCSLCFHVIYWTHVGWKLLFPSWEGIFSVDYLNDSQLPNISAKYYLVGYRNVRFYYSHSENRLLFPARHYVQLVLGLRLWS